jgi:hypothetical protein
MIHEFSLDPGVAQDWQSLRYVLDQSGFPHGRLISEYPKEWRRMAYEAAAKISTPVNAKRVEVLLQAAKSKLLPGARHYDPNRDWLPNAVEQHRTRPFRAIISNENPMGHDAVLIPEALTETTPLWHTQRETKVPRTAAALSNAVSVLLKQSREVLLVDQHFDPDEKRFQRTLQSFIGAALSAVPKKRIEYHLKIQRKLSTERFRTGCESQLPQLIPVGVVIRFIRWQARKEGEDFHPRYVLTERGGIRIDAGLDEGKKGETTDISLLPNELYQKRWQEYQRETAAFEHVDDLLIQGTQNNNQPMKGGDYDG